MAAKNTVFGTSFLQLLFNGTNPTALAGLAINATSSPLTSLYVALHTADPTVGGNQTSNEIAYTGYTRVAVARTSGGWTVTGETVNPAATISFPAGTGGSGTAAFWSVGTSLSGAGQVLYSGPISPTIVCGNAVTPQLGTGTSVTES